MKLRLTVVLMLAAGSLSAASTFAGCSDDDSSSSGSQATIPLLRVGLLTGITTLDDTTAGNFGRLVGGLGLETLTVPDATQPGAVKPWLAQSVSRPGPTEYVYHLRKGVKFWNGNELTAEDVAHSLNYQRRPGSQLAFNYNSVESIEPTDRYTVTVTLKAPDPTWEFNASIIPALIFEKKFQQEHKSSFGKPGTLVMGTGPWEIKSLDPTRGAELTANPDWWHGKPPIDRISVKFYADESSMALAFRAGEIDVIPFPIGDPKAFAATADTELLTTNSCSEVTYFAMPYHTGPWSDVHVRRAVAYAVDRDDLVSAIGGYAEPSTTFLAPLMLRAIYSPTQLDELIESLPQYPTDLDKAKQELAQSSYPDGFTYTLEAPKNQNLSNVSQALAGQLRPLGIDLKVKVITQGEWLAQISGPAADRPANVAASGCLAPDPSGLDYNLGTQNTEPGQFNIANYDPPEVDKLVAAGKSSSDEAERRAIYEELLTRLGRDVVYLPLYVRDSAYASSSKFSWEVNPFTWYSGTWPLEVKPQ